ncbi:hypothetical protein HDU67_005865, partial [Dinochytrium kinnereticum]
GIVSDNIKFYYFKHKMMPTEVEVEVDDLQIRAQEHGIHDVFPYIQSSLFKSSFTYDRSRKVITKVLEHHMEED